MIPTTLNFARNLASAWLPWFIIAAFITAAAWTVRKVYAWASADVERMVREALDDEAADDEWRAICAAIGLTPRDMRARWLQQEAANRAALETTRREIAALPTTEQP